MAGTRQDGILLTDDIGGGGGAPVEINSPLGSQLAADSVSVAIASDQLPLPIDGTLSGAVDQGEPAAILDAWPILVTDGVNFATIRAGGSKADFATDEALVVESRTTETQAVALTSTRFLAIGGGDQSGNAARLPLRSAVDQPQRADVDPGIIVRPCNPIFTTSGSISALAQAVSTQLLRYNGGTLFITIITGGSFSGTLECFLQDGSSGSGAIPAFRAADGKRVTVLDVPNSLGTMYFIPTSGATIGGVRCTAYTSGSVTVRLSTFPGFAGFNNAWTTGVSPGQREMLFGSLSQGAAGTTALVAADATRKVKLVSYQICMDAAGTVQFTDGTANLSGAMAVDDKIDMCAQPNNHIIETAAINRPLNLVTTTGAAKGHFSYFLEP